MTVPKRPGVNPKWAKGWKAHLKNQIESHGTFEPHITRELEHFAEHGKPFTPPEYVVQGKYKPPYREWERYHLDDDLSLVAHLRLFEVERQSMAGGVFNAKTAVHAFAAAYTSQVIDLEFHYLSLARYGEQRGFLPMNALPFTALGMILGCKTEATALARAQLAGYQKHWFGEIASFGATEKVPVYMFILRILAAHLEQPVPEPGTNADPIFDALFDLWRTPSTDELAQTCLAACDSHTHRCVSGEFDNGNWTRLPIEILLLFKLRQIAGLQNPALDHPLMNTPLGQLPSEVRFEPDDLVKRVRARIAKHGYDEEAILAKVIKPAKR